jgi:hypothetical protein
MKGRWKPPKEDRTDAESIRREREFQRDLSDILEYGTEEDFVALLKAHTPGIGREELKASIMQFRVYVREKRGL